MTDALPVKLALLKKLVIDAGKEELLPRFQNIDFSYKQDGSVVTEADLSVQARLQQALLDLSPQIPLLGEEMSEQEQAAIIDDGSSFWCLDPLDGTSNFAAGIPFFSISLALIENGQPVIGIVYDPVRDECFLASSGQAAFLNGEALIVSQQLDRPLARCTATVDFKRLSTTLASRIATDPPYYSQRSFGSVALDWAWLAAGRGQLYLHGKQKLWDYAAGWLILSEAGGVSSTLDGETGFHASLTPRSAVAASNPGLFHLWLDWLNA